MPYTTLISAADLAMHNTDPNWVIVDCRHDLSNPQAGQDAYAAGHIPQALFAHLDRDLSDKSPGPNGAFRGRHPLPTQEAFIETLRNWGINEESQAIAYDAHGGMFAARLWWMLRWVGHEAVAVLDGGLPSWTAQGHALASEVPRKPRGTIAPHPALANTVDAAVILAGLTQGAHTVVDARAPDRFRGENETLDPVGGHIPGAKNRFFKDNLLPNGQFKPADGLRSEFAGLIANPQSAIMQCGSGVTACHNLLALEIAGLPGAALYPGSWSEWCSDPSRPIAKGEE